MPNSRRLKVLFAVGALGAVFSQAYSLDIVINAGATLAGNGAALASFDRAAQKWEALFSDNITVTINADMANMGGGGVIGATGSVMLQDSYTNVRNQMVADAGDEGLSNSIVGFLPTAAQFSGQLPAGRSFSGAMVASKANLKAMGYTGLDGAFGAADANMTFNTQFAFHFGAGAPPAGLMDFETVVVHEIGHALGFISAVDSVAGGQQSVGIMPLDMFRFANNNLPTTNAEFTTKARNFVPGTAASFSDTVNNWGMSTVSDGRQASHWKSDELTGTYIGVMDPTLDFGIREPITGADIRAFDLIGWDMVQPVPEPATLAALGLGAAALIRRKRNKK